MEPQHTNANNEHVQKIAEVKQENGTPLLVDKNSSPVSPLEPRAEENLTSASHEPSQMKSPPIIQTMAQPLPPGYDPNRIPSSIFSTKPSNPTEWSVASNESLFSIHMGNNSFSRDYAILFGKSGDLQDWHASQLRMSGELPRLDGWNNNNNNNNNNNLNSLPPVIESPLHEKSKGDESSKVDSMVKSEQRDHKGKAMPVETNLEKHEKKKPVPVAVVNITPPNGADKRPDVKKAVPVETNNMASPRNPSTFPSPPRFSNDSGNSGSSFAFPVLVSDGGKPESLKVVPEKHEPPASPAQVSKETPEASETRWCSFSWCWPRCC